MARVVAPLPPGSFRYGGGAAEHGSRPIGNWWSDHAVDLMTRAGTLVIALEDLTVSSVTRRASTGTGVNDGSTVFAKGASGEEYAFLHLDPGLLPAVGQRLAAGTPFARVAAGTAGGPHLHLGVKDTDPTELVKYAAGGGGRAAGKGVRPGPGGSGQSGGVVGDVAGGAVDVAKGAVNAVRSVADFIEWITNPHNILRGLQVLAGAVLVLTGVVLLARQVALAADLPAPERVPLPGGRDLYQSAGYAGSRGNG